MTDRTIMLRSDLVERLETLAERPRQSLDDIFGEIQRTVQHLEASLILQCGGNQGS